MVIIYSARFLWYYAASIILTFNSLIVYSIKSFYLPQGHNSFGYMSEYHLVNLSFKVLNILLQVAV